MSWSFNTLEQWVNAALINIGYTESEARLGANSVTWLQQRGAPGVAAMAQHIDFLSAYELTPNQGGDANAQCPIQLSESLQAQTNSTNSAQTFNGVRQPLLLLPALAKNTGTVRWNEYELDLHSAYQAGHQAAQLNIEYERKTLRQVLIEKTDVHWEPRAADSGVDVGATPANTSKDAPSNCHLEVLTDIPARELAYVKTLQHYAGALPPREPLDGAPTTDNAIAELNGGSTGHQPENRAES